MHTRRPVRTKPNFFMFTLPERIVDFFRVFIYDDIMSELPRPLSRLFQTFAILLVEPLPSGWLWHDTRGRSPRQTLEAIALSVVRFLEWDPGRGLYYLDLSGPQTVTSDVGRLELRRADFSDHYRFEWSARSLNGIELQTHAPQPLPFLPDLTHLLSAAQSSLSRASLSLEEWEGYIGLLKIGRPP